MWLIKTYSNEGEVVLDNAAGSMSTAIAAIATNRKCICIEKDENFFNVGKERVENYLREKEEAPV
jgi:site-specific DNA-methyltransferase (adenine-specific)